MEAGGWRMEAGGWRMEVEDGAVLQQQSEVITEELKGKAPQRREEKLHHLPEENRCSSTSRAPQT